MVAAARFQLQSRSSCRAVRPFPQHAQLGLLQGAVCTDEDLRPMVAAARFQLQSGSSCRAVQPFPQQAQLGLVQGTVDKVRLGSASHGCSRKVPASIQKLLPSSAALPASGPAFQGCCLYCQMRIYVPLVTAARFQLQSRSSCRAAQPFLEQALLGLLQGTVGNARWGSVSHGVVKVWAPDKLRIGTAVGSMKCADSAHQLRCVHSLSYEDIMETILPKEPI